MGEGLSFSVYRFLWCKYCHFGQVQATNVMPLSLELGRDPHTWLLQASTNSLCTPVLESITIKAVL